MSSTLIIWDWNRTLFNPETKMLYLDALVVLEALHAAGCVQVLVSKCEASGIEDIRRLVPSKIFVKASIISKKTLWTFLKLAIRYRRSKHYVIGDRVRGEILYGNVSGCKTVWIRQGKFSDQIPRWFLERPDVAIANLTDVLPLFFGPDSILQEESDTSNNPREASDYHGSHSASHSSSGTGS
ncbi:MAG: HAD hydrolase-like protein [Patescibacteria group bacterium]